MLQLAIPIIADKVRSIVEENDELDDNDPDKKNRIEIRKNIRTLIKTNMRTAKTYFGDMKYFLTDNKLSNRDEDYQISVGLFEKSLNEFRRKSKDFRSEALRLFEDEYERDVVVTPTYNEDITDEEGNTLHEKGDRNVDLITLLNIAKKRSINLFKKKSK